MKELRLGFIHIPKTAGTSFGTFLNETLGRSTIVYLTETIEAELAMNAIVSGHIPYYIFADEIRPRILITVLRNPIERVRSIYDYILSNEAHYAHEVVRGLTIVDCLTHPLVRAEFSNLQTRMLGYDRSLSHPIACRKQSMVALSRYDHRRQYLNDDLDRSTLGAAMANLQNDVFYSILEDLGPLVDLIAHLGKKPVQSFPRLNVTAGTRRQISRSELAAVAAHNRLDLELYDFAKRNQWSQRKLWDPAAGEEFDSYPAAALDQ